MNKQLLSFVALVAVGLLGASGTAVAQKKMKASKPTISLGGYGEFGLEFIDNGDAIGLNTGGLASFYNAEVYFNIAGQLDNGIKFGGRWQLETNNLGAGETGSGQDPGETFDETYITISGSFGQLRLGGADNSAMSMVTGYQGSWATSVAHNLAFERAEIVPNPRGGYSNRGPGFGVREDLGDADDPKITYFSPRFGGFQIGGSFAKDVGRHDPDSPINQHPGRTENLFTVSANFDRKFDGFRLGIAGGYLQDEPGVTATEKTPGIRKAYVGGLLVESGPFKAAFGVNINEDPNLGLNNTDGAGYDVGVRYTMGSHGFGLAYFWAEVEGNSAIAGDDESATLWLTHAYAMGPGVRWLSTLGWTDWDDETAEARLENDGWGMMTSIRLDF